MQIIVSPPQNAKNLRHEEADLMVRMHQGGVRQVEISELFKCDLKNSYIRFRKQPFPTARQHIMHNMHNIVNATGLEYQMKQ